MKVVILVGVPGSGKSTFCKKYPAYVRISQDELGSRYMCLELFRESLRKGKSVIVDRCNINKMQRQLWLNIAKEFNVDEINCVTLSVTPEEAIKRIKERKDHPTIKDLTDEKMASIVYNFINTYEAPELSEGYDKVLFIDNN